MPTTRAPEGATSHSTTTRLRGKRLFGLLLGVWPLALAIAAVAVAFGSPTAMTLGSALAVALTIDFLTIVAILEVDDGDPDINGSSDHFA